LALGALARIIPRRREEVLARARAQAQAQQSAQATEAQESVKESLRTFEVELVLGKQLAPRLLMLQGELADRVAKMRRKFAQIYGFVVPEIKVSDSLTIPPKSYQIKIHGTVVASAEVRIGDVLVVTGEGPRPDLPYEEGVDPAFGIKAVWVAESFRSELKREGFRCIDNASAVLTHVSEVVRNNLAQLLSYKDMRALLERLDPEYKKLIEDICPAQITFSGLQSVLKLLLAERVSIRNLHLILEAIAEIAPHARRAEQVAEHVRLRMSQQICGDLVQDGVLKLLRLGNRWDLAFHKALKRDAKGDVTELDFDPKLMDEFAVEASDAIRRLVDEGVQFALITTPEARPYVRMIIERMFSSLPVLSHLEIARGVEVNSLGTVS
jgi:flagellar biosynthesis protein FlhA